MSAHCICILVSVLHLQIGSRLPKLTLGRQIKDIKIKYHEVNTLVLSLSTTGF